MSPPNKKHIFVSFLIVLSAFIAIHFLARAFLHRIGSVPPKCHWSGDSFGDCIPLEARLEIRTTSDPASKGSAVWYRVAIMNVSDKTLRLHSDFFVSNLDSSGAIDSGLGGRIVVKDPRGSPLPAAFHQDFATPAPRGIAAASGRIIPYDSDASHLTPYLQTTFYKRDPMHFSKDLILPPGLTVTTSSNILKPHRMEFKTVETPDFIGTAAIPVPAEESTRGLFAVPPAGFRRMAEYELKEAGTFTASFEYDGIVFVEPAASAPGGSNDRLLSLIRFSADPLDWFGSGGIELHAGSAPVAFQVER